MNSQQQTLKHPSCEMEFDRVLAEKLFQGARQLVIEYKGQDYVLRITRNDKLILTK